MSTGWGTFHVVRVITITVIFCFSDMYYILWCLSIFFNEIELRVAGYQASTLKEAGGLDAVDLVQAGFPIRELRIAGFTSKSLKDAGASAKHLKEGGFSLFSLRDLDYTAEELRERFRNVGLDSPK